MLSWPRTRIFRRHAIQEAASIAVDILCSHGQLWSFECTTPALFNFFSSHEAFHTLHVTITSPYITLVSALLTAFRVVISVALHLHPSATRLLIWRSCQGFLETLRQVVTMLTKHAMAFHFYSFLLPFVYPAILLNYGSLSDFFVL